MKTMEAKITTVLIDDEQGARESLANLLSKYVDNIEVIGKADSASTGYNMIQELKPNLVFLDVEMPNGNAFDLLEKFETIDFHIIFVTAYDHYAIKAIKYSAIDYLLKPIDLDELRSAVEKYKALSGKSKDINEKIKLLLSNLSNDVGAKKIVVPDNEGLNLIHLQDIVRCESDGDYTNIDLANGKRILSANTLGDYEDLLTNSGFFRIHRSSIINLSHIKKYIRGEGGSVVMSDGSEVEVSRRKKAEFLDKL